jgi:general secretion pathway protein K
MSTRPVQQHGFILATVLWLLAGLTVIAGLLSSYGVSAAERAYALRLRTAAELSYLNTRSEILVLLAATRSTSLGRTGAEFAFQVDNRLYKGKDGSLVRVQDVNGLIDLNSSNDKVLEKLFVVCGADETSAAGLVARLRDYTDSDDLVRIEGAEKEDYSSAGLAKPRNMALQEPLELWQVLGMSKIRATWEARGCDDIVAINVTGVFNIRTAPYIALLAMGFEDSVAGVLAGGDKDGEALRMAQSLNSFDQSSNPLAQTFSTIAGRNYRVQHFQPESGLQFTYWVALNTSLPETPWLLKGESITTLSSQLQKSWQSNPDGLQPINLPSFNRLTPKETDSASPNPIPFL